MMNRRANYSKMGRKMTKIHEVNSRSWRTTMMKTTKKMSSKMKRVRIEIASSAKVQS
jgi:hypothetical protein